MSSGNWVGRRILVVEDEAVVAMLLEDMLIDLGCEIVGPVANVEQALAVLDAETVDAAVLDVNLNGQPSYRIADALADRGRPFLFITGYGEAGLDDGYRQRPVVQKPFTRERLAQALGGLDL
ncbi:response regulator [Sphingomonas quercus]|uniref:Response regulator n=1 Tax=Sphingomonas quercus TaxID=2842451 RepID=A0ABS6BDM9_9SPHN|nr:response regulator [Sphingomonas quercus]MBU3076415.1 response regulator [Sphingomonas quercus]